MKRVKIRYYSPGAGHIKDHTTYTSGEVQGAVDLFKSVFGEAKIIDVFVKSE